jgi:hypothetical protein
MAKGKSDTAEASSSSSASGVSMGFWSVAYLDLLGYRGALKAIDVYPLPPPGPEREALTRQAVRPFQIRRRLVDGVNSFMKASLENPETKFSNLTKANADLAAIWSWR